MSYRNLIHQPFPQRGLRWGTEPTSQQSGSPGQANAIIPVTFGARVVGAAGTYPIANRVATQSFTMAIGLLSASLSTSIVNATSDTPYAIIVARDVGPNMNILAGVDALVEHVCEQGLGHSFRSGVGFADDIAPKFGSNEQIAIYVVSSGTGAAGSASTSIVTLRYFPYMP